MRLEREGVGVDRGDQQHAVVREQPAQPYDVVGGSRQMREHRPQRDDVEAAGGDLRHVLGRAEMRVAAAGASVRRLDRIRRQVDAVRVEAALVGELEEESGAAAVVEQPPLAARREQRREAVHDPAVAVLAAARVVTGQEPGVVAAAVEVAEPLGPDARIAVQEAAAGAAHDAVAPASRPARREERLQLTPAAEPATEQLLARLDRDGRAVLLDAQRRPAPEPRAPPQLGRARGAGQGVPAHVGIGRNEAQALHQQAAGAFADACGRDGLHRRPP